MPGGLQGETEACRAFTPNGYHDQYGTNDTVTSICGSAFQYCWVNVYMPYNEVSGVTYRHPNPPRLSLYQTRPRLTYYRLRQMH